MLRLESEMSGLSNFAIQTDPVLIFQNSVQVQPQFISGLNVRHVLRFSDFSVFATGDTGLRRQKMTKTLPINRPTAHTKKTPSSLCLSFFKGVVMADFL